MGGKRRSFRVRIRTILIPGQLKSEVYQEMQVQTVKERGTSKTPTEISTLQHEDKKTQIHRTREGSTWKLQGDLRDGPQHSPEKLSPE